MSQSQRTIEALRAPQNSGERVAATPEEVRKISKKLIFGLKNMIFMIFSIIFDVLYRFCHALCSTRSVVSRT